MTLADHVRQTALLAWPSIVGQLAVVGMNFVDTALAGRISARVLAEVAIGSAIWGIVLLCILGTVMALSPTVATLRGADGRLEIASVLNQGIYLALVAAVLGLLALQGAPWLMRALAVDAELTPGATRFLIGVQWGAPALAMHLTLLKFCEGMGRTRPSLYFGVSGLLLLAPIGYVLMNGKLGFPRLESYGCGLATAIVTWINLLGVASYVWLSFRDIGALRCWALPDWPRLRQLATLGVPIAFTILMEAGLFYVVLLLISRFGQQWAAAHAVAINVASLAFMIPLGLANAVTIRVGFLSGQNLPEQARFAGFSGYLLCLVTQASSATLIILLAGTLARLYLPHDPEVAELATALLVLAAVFQFPDGIQVISGGALRGLQDTRWPMLFSIIAYWGLGFPLAYFLAFHTRLGAPGLWYGFILGLSAACVMLTWRFLRISKPAKPDVRSLSVSGADK